MARRALNQLCGCMLGMAAIAATTCAHEAWSSPLHKLASNTVAFSSDGSRYAAWQEDGKPDFVLIDTATNQTRRVPLPPGCQLHDEAEGGELIHSAAAGRFLIDCESKERQLLLDIRSGQSLMLPRIGPEASWAGVGTRYVEGYGGEHRTLYDVSSGRVSRRGEAGVIDLDRRGAGPDTVCRRLRRAVVKEVSEGAEWTYSYRAGMFARRHGSPGDVQIERCHDRARILHARGGSVRGHGEPVNFDLRGGLLSWDTGGLAADVIPGERRFLGRMYAYDLARHRRASWRLPQVIARGGEEPVRGTYGHSAHTSNAMFWLATQSLDCYEVCDVGTSAVYAARM